jgi:hypothetical protein
MTNHPQNDDAVAGNGHNPLASASVLGAFDGFKARLTAGDASALQDAIRYGEAATPVIREFFKHPDHSQFFIDMIKAKRVPRLGDQRFMWSGPSLYCKKSELLTIIRLTTVDLIWENLGQDELIIYPAAYSQQAIQAGLRVLIFDSKEDLARLTTAIALCYMQGDPLKRLAENFVQQIWNVFVAVPKQSWMIGTDIRNYDQPLCHAGNDVSQKAWHYCYIVVDDLVAIAPKSTFKIERAGTIEELFNEGMFSFLDSLPVNPPQSP